MDKTAIENELSRAYECGKSGGYYYVAVEASKLLAALNTRSPVEGAVACEVGEPVCQEDDGCPMEKAVLQREWRKMKALLANPPVAVPVVDEAMVERAMTAFKFSTAEMLATPADPSKGDWPRMLMRRALEASLSTATKV